MADRTLGARTASAQFTWSSPPIRQLPRNARNTPKDSNPYTFLGGEWWKAMHTSSCGGARGLKCRCSCGGALHGTGLGGRRQSGHSLGHALLTTTSPSLAESAVRKITVAVLRKVAVGVSCTAAPVACPAILAIDRAVTLAQITSKACLA